MEIPAQPFGLPQAEPGSGTSGLEFLKGLLEGRYSAPPFAEVADIWPTSVERGHVVFEATPSSRFYNPMGSVHGGWLAMLLDTAMGCAVHSALDPGQGYTTIDLQTTFVRSVRESTGRIRCQGTLLHMGGRVASSEGRIFDAHGALLAHGSERCLIFPTKPGRSPRETPSTEVVR